MNVLRSKLMCLSKPVDTKSVHFLQIMNPLMQWVETNPSYIVFSLRTSVLLPPDGTKLTAFTDVAGCQMGWFPPNLVQTPGKGKVYEAYKWTFLKMID